MHALLTQCEKGDELANYCLQTNMSQVDIFTPLTRRQALSSPQSEEWLKAEKKGRKYWNKLFFHLKESVEDKVDLQVKAWS